MQDAQKPLRAIEKRISEIFLMKIFTPHYSCNVFPFDYFSSASALVLPIIAC
jgi:hypothetical protein